MAHPELSTIDQLVGAFVAYERRARGLRERTLQNYGGMARLLIGEALGVERIDIAALGPGDVRQFIDTMTSRYSARSMKTVRTALRAFFGFLRVEGLCEEPLEIAIPAMPSWRRTTLPQCLSDEQLCTLLASCDSSTACGRRDRAMIICLSSLGLRPGELAGLRLEDIDWRSGTVHLTTRKTRRGAVLPLPRDVGRALVDYLRRERPKTDERCLFVQHLGRRTGTRITSGVVSAAVFRALRRAGIESPISGAYVLRHTAASRLVRQGTPLKEIADLLGHRCLDTTAIYAKVDVPALQEVALPWPEVNP